ncbi:MAG: alpha-galactosidase [Anaerolineales bacterium]|nr:alpha-galactosidase [Anaerolineales bacterium]
MTRIVFIGAGSLRFTRELVRDILTFPILRDSTITLMDVNPERLDYAQKAVRRIIELGEYPAKIETTMDRVGALKEADAVICTILADSTEVWKHDIEIPMKYGVDINIGDTRGPAGVFRALRTLPVMLDIVKDMERYCPEAYLLNYTNPMSMLCRAIQRESFIQTVGLCHSVQSTAEMLARWIDRTSDEIEYLCAGINHQAWFLKLEWSGEDVYPLIRKAVMKPEIYNEEIVRNEMFIHMGYYVTESSGHSSEYNWWFRKRPDLIEKYCTHGTGWNPGEHAYILNEYQREESTWRKNAESWLEEVSVMDLGRGNEYAAYIINALMGGEPFEFNGNVANNDLIKNLPDEVCVEVPVLADRKGFHPIQVGALPHQVLPLNHINAMADEMAVEGALRGDPELIVQSIAYDPLTAAVLSLQEIKDMVKELFHQHREHLPQFKNLKL